MDKILSARVDEKVLRRLAALAKRLHTSKKAVIERAISDLAERTENEPEDLELTASFGAWQRAESPETSVEQSRTAFQDAMERHHR